MHDISKKATPFYFWQSVSNGNHASILPPSSQHMISSTLKTVKKRLVASFELEYKKVVSNFHFHWYADCVASIRQREPVIKLRSVGHGRTVNPPLPPRTRSRTPSHDLTHVLLVNHPAYFVRDTNIGSMSFFHFVPATFFLFFRPCCYIFLYLCYVATIWLFGLCCHIIVVLAELRCHMLFTYECIYWKILYF